MRIQLQPTDDRPLYVQIMDEIRRGLVRGTVGPDDLLPSVRELASELRVNPRTVSQAYAELEREGIVTIQRGRGTFVSPGVRPEQRQRPRLARQVARRALADASRNGLVLHELLAALREVGENDGGSPPGSTDSEEEAE